MGAAKSNQPSMWRSAKRLAPLLLPWVFVSRFVAALRWVQANDLSGKGRFEEALRLARTLPPEVKARNDWKAFEIQQLSLLEWNLETIDAVNRFLTEHKFGPTPDEDLRYLITFAQWCGRMAIDRLAEPGTPYPSAFVSDPAEIDLEKVDRFLKRHFPLPIHPNWEAPNVRRLRGKKSG